MKQFIIKHKALTALIGLILILFQYAFIYNIYLIFHFKLMENDISTLSKITGRDYTGTEITDIKTSIEFFGDERGTDLYIFLREDAVFKNNPDYDDSAYKGSPYYEGCTSSLDQFGRYFYEQLHAAGIEREYLISCGTHFKSIEIIGGMTQQDILWMPMNDSYDGYSNVLIYTSMPEWIVKIPNKELLIGKH